jgi:hypothetical protein
VSSVQPALPDRVLVYLRSLTVAPPCDLLVFRVDERELLVHDRLPQRRVERRGVTVETGLLPALTLGAEAYSRPLFGST